MTPILDALGWLLAAGGVLVLLFGFARGARQAVALALELWTAAGLLRLCGEPSWGRIATAAALIGVRKLVGLRPQA